MSGSGITTINFGAFPGTSHATVAVTGQTSILSVSLVEAWIFPAATADHSSDEHVVLASQVQIVAAEVVAGVGFTIHAIARFQPSEPLTQIGADRNHRSNLAAVANNNNRPELFPSVGGRATDRVWGLVQVAWVWS